MALIFIPHLRPKYNTNQLPNQRLHAYACGCVLGRDGDALYEFSSLNKGGPPKEATVSFPSQPQKYNQESLTYWVPGSSLQVPGQEGK